MVKRPMQSDHMRIDERSIALHQAVVAKIRLNPRLLDIPRANLQRLEADFSIQGRKIPRWLKEWKEILENPDREEVFSFLVCREEKASRLRQSSPFSGILTPNERWTIYETFAAGAHHPGGEQHHG